MSELFTLPLKAAGTYIEDANRHLVGKAITLASSGVKGEDAQFELAKKRAAFIAEAVNSHEMLLAMAKKYYESLPDDGPEQDYYAKYIIGAGGTL